jgi:hypothetical protein
MRPGEPRHITDASPGVWVLNWFLNDLNPTQEYFSEDRYPKVHAWVRRYRKELDVAKARVRKSISLGGADAVRLIVSSDFSDKDIVVDEMDPLRLKAGVEVDLFPTDGGGFTHQVRRGKQSLLLSHVC